jgi:hypothetical protein
LFNFFLSTLTNTHTHRYIYIYIYIYMAALFYILGVEWDFTPNQPNSSVNLTPTQTDSTPPPPDPLRHPAPEGSKRRTREGGSEWEPIKILTQKNSAYIPISTPSHTQTSGSTHKPPLIP